jgi:hypothetical protein
VHVIIRITVMKKAQSRAASPGATARPGGIDAASKELKPTPNPTARPSGTGSKSAFSYLGFFVKCLAVALLIVLVNYDKISQHRYHENVAAQIMKVAADVGPMFSTLYCSFSFISEDAKANCAAAAAAAAEAAAAAAAAEAAAAAKAAEAAAASKAAAAAAKAERIALKAAAVARANAKEQSAANCVWTVSDSCGTISLGLLSCPAPAASRFVLFSPRRNRWPHHHCGQMLSLGQRI